MDPKRVAGKKALVTGAGQGLGAAIAAMLARHGAIVTVTDVDAGRADAVAAVIREECGPGAASAQRLDVTDPAEWAQVIEQAGAAMGGLSVLVNNAGIAPIGTIEGLDLETWQRTMAINVDGALHGMRAALPLMRESQPGSIVNISSIAGLVASHAFAAYNSSKAALWMLTKSVALHCAKQGLDIRCNSVHPTFADTPLLEGLVAGTREEREAKLARQIPLGRIATPDDIAYGVLYLASDESRMMTGAELKLDGGLSAM